MIDVGLRLGLTLTFEGDHILVEAMKPAQQADRRKHQPINDLTAVERRVNTHSCVRMYMSFMYFLDPTRNIRKEELKLATAHFSHHVSC
jgi:hypothetical protein